MVVSPAVKKKNRSRISLVVSDELSETIRLDAVINRLRPRDVVEERLRESFRRRPVSTPHTLSES